MNYSQVIVAVWVLKCINFKPALSSTNKAHKHTERRHDKPLRIKKREKCTSIQRKKESYLPASIPWVHEKKKKFSRGRQDNI